MPRALFSHRFQPIVPWVEENIHLSDTSPIPGRIKLFPWQRDVLMAYEDPKIRQVSMMISSQLGKSVVCLCVLGYHIGSSPRNMLLVQPTLKVLDRFRSEKILPMLESSPTINEKIHRTQVGTVPRDHIPYDGGDIFIAYSGSPASLKSLSVPLVICDEVDSYKGNADTANPLSILWQRAHRFGKRAKMLVASTPVESGTSLIEQEFNEGTQEYYCIPCPHCELAHPIDWDNIRSGKLFCPGCGAEINEEERVIAVERKGFWRAESSNEHHRSFHINQLYSTTKTLADTASEYRENNPRGFYTQVLGVPFRSLVNVKLEPENVKDLYTETWDLGDGPMGYQDATAVTAAVDIQLNRLELQVCLWRDMVPRISAQIRIPVVEERYEESFGRLHAELLRWQPDMIFVDRHYPSPDDISRWAQTYLHYWLTMGRMWLIVGTENSFNSPLIRRRPTATNPFFAALAVDTGKEWVHSLIRNKSMSVNPYNVPEDFANQLTSEELRQVVTSAGKEKKAWVKTRRLNEALDCFVYNACAREALGMDFSRKTSMSWEEAMELIG